MKKKNIYFAFLKVSRRVIDNFLNMKTIVYVVYRYLQNDEKTFKESEAKTRDDIFKFYKDLTPPSYLSVEFSADIFNSDRRFSTAMKASIFSAIEDAIVDRRV